MNYSKRLRDLSKKLSIKNIDGMVISSPPNLRYFFNYAGESFERLCCGLIKDGKSALVLPKLDTEKAAKSHADHIFPWTDSEGYTNALKKAIQSIGFQGERIGCEAGGTFALVDQLRAGFGTQSVFMPIIDEISNLRLIKDREEISEIKNSAAKLSRVFKSIPDIIQVGKTESEIALEITRELLKRGLKSLDFPLVQSGPNSSIPHSIAGPKRIRTHDTIVVDIGATNDAGYFADFTRSYVVGKPSQKQEEIYARVREAQEVGLQASVSGREAEAVDRATRSSIERSGYGQSFFHRTGHGLGLEVHEAPFIKEGNSARLERGMVFTVEPGIYLPGNFGVRIEDNVIIGTKTENITKLSHELIQI